MVTASEIFLGSQIRQRGGGVKPDAMQTSLVLYLVSLGNCGADLAPKLFVCPPLKIQGLMCSVKDDFVLRRPGIYQIACEYVLNYIGQMEHTILRLLQGISKLYSLKLPR